MVDRVQAGKRAQLTSCVPPVVFRSTWHGMLREIIARLRVKVLQESIMEVQPDAKKTSTITYWQKVQSIPGCKGVV